MKNNPASRVRDSPFVSVFMAVRNEGKTIERCLGAFIEQSYPRNRFELVIADKSEDETVPILKKFSELYPEQIRVMHNHSGRTVDGLNISLLQSRGRIVVLYIGHAYPEIDFIANIVAALSDGEADLVGGRVIPESPTGRIPSTAIALALRHPFTIGKNSYTMKKRCVGKSMHWMAVKKELVDIAGVFNVRYSPRGEDCEWYERLIAVGGIAVYDPSIVSHYFVRETFRGQFLIQVKNAYYRMQPFFDSGRCARIHHLAPVVAAVIIALAGIVCRSLVPVVFILSVYLIAALCVSVTIVKKRILYWPFVLWAIILIHTGHGIGIVAGFLRFAPKALGTRLVSLCASLSFLQKVE